MTKNNLKPALRFKGFTEAWEQYKLSDLFEKGGSGGTPLSTNPDYYNGNIPFLGISDITNSNGLILETEKYITVKGLDNSAAWIVPSGSISLAMYASVGKLAILGVNAATSQAFYNMVFNSDSVRDFVYHRLYKANSDSEWDKLISTGTQSNLNAEKVKEFEISIPNNDLEISKIGSLFRTLDNLITLHQRKYDSLVNIKKSLLQKMFPQKNQNTPEIRFKGFTEAWEQRKLSDLAKATGGTSIESEFIEGGKYKVISIGSYGEDSKYRDQGIRANKTSKTQERILSKGDLTMILNDKTASGNIIGRVLLIDQDDMYVYNQRTQRLEIDKVIYDPQFIYHYLNADSIRNKIIKASQGNTQIYVNYSNICKFEYFLPIRKDEQIKLGEFFEKLDNLITLHQRKLEKLKNVKKACLKKMFV
ncbi:MAG: restriction endonuclease subunit S [Christensenellales bacterium]